jgi:uncharacterized membrane protein YfcA
MTILLYLLLGVGIGTVGGMVGIGGGVLLIPALTAFLNVEPRKAAGISLAVLAIPVTLPGALRYYTHGYITRTDLLMIGCLAIAFAVGTTVGAQVQHYLDVSVLKIIFGALLLYVGMRTLLYASPETYHAAAGVAATALGLLAYFWLRALGRKHIPRPNLGDAIRKHAETSPGPDEYYI